MSSSMQQMEETVARMIAGEFVHRDGTQLGHVTREQILKRLRAEIQEFEDATGCIHRREELGDVLGIFVHLVHFSGFTLDEVAHHGHQKLFQRFTPPRRKLDFDPDLSPEHPHNQRVAAERGLKYDSRRQVFADEDGCPTRDRYGQPLG